MLKKLYLHICAQIHAAQKSNAAKSIEFKEALPQASLMQALEPRLMFDGAAIEAVNIADGVSNVEQNYILKALNDNEHAKAAQDFLEAISQNEHSINSYYEQFTEVAIIDSRVKDPHILIESISRDAAIEVILPDSDGVEAIATILEKYNQLDAVHIFSHGAQAELQLGDMRLNDNNLMSYAASLSQWGKSLTSTGDILFYGCNVAEGKRGQVFLEQLKSVTQADVAASTDKTGNAFLGANWILEFNNQVEHQNIINDPERYQYDLSEEVKLLSDINNGVGSSNVNYLTAIGNQLFFSADDGTNGNELYTYNTDNPGAGVTLVADINPGASSSSPRNLTAIGNQLFFSADDGTNGNELYTYNADNPGAGVTLVADIRPDGGYSVGSGGIVAIGNQLFFDAFEGHGAGIGVELYKYDFDNPSAGATLVSDLFPGDNSSFPKYLTAIGNQLFFSAQDGTNGNELYTYDTDNPGAGITLVTDINANSNGLRGLTAIGNQLFFGANTGTYVYDTNNPGAGARSLGGASVTALTTFIPIDNQVFFGASDSNVSELYTYDIDNPSAGMTKVDNLYPGGNDGIFSDFTRIGNQLFFNAQDGTTGYELYTYDTDNPGAGITLVTDINPGASSGYVDNLTAIGNQLFFSADDGNFGRELYTYSLTFPPINTVIAPQTINEDSELIINGLSVHQPVGANIESTSLQATTGVLNITLSGSAIISAGSNNSSGLTISGSESDINNSLLTLTYQSDLNFNGSDTIIMTSTNDQGDTDIDEIAINILPVNDAPTLVVTPLNPGFAEGDSPKAIFTGATIDLVEGADLVKALTLTVGDLQNGNDEKLYIDGQAIALVAGSGTTTANNYVYNITELAGTATVTLTHASDIAVTDAQSLIDGLQYENTSEDIAGTSRTVTLTTLQDTGGTANGGDDTASVTIASTVSLLAVNDAPVLTAGNILNYTENQPATIIDPTVTIQDVDNVNLESATISIGNYVLGNDVLAFANTGTITGSFDVTTGVLTLTGSDTLANYESALRSVTYQNISNEPGTTKTITWLVNDGQNNSAGVISTIAIAQVNDEPILTATTLEPNFTENTSPVAVFSGTTIDLVEGADLVKALTLTVSDLQNGNDEKLYIDGQAIALVAGSGTTTANNYVYNITELAGTATVTLTHASDIAVTDAQSLIDGLQYENTSENIVGTSRTVTLTTLQDTGGTANGGDDTASVTIASTVSLLAVNDTPVLTAGNTLNYTENQPATIIDPTVTIQDVDNVNLESATISIGNYVLGNDVLAFANTGTITGSFDVTTGVLTLTGSDTLANYESALRSVTYQNISNEPGTTKTITWVVNDGQNNSAGVISTIAIAQVNDAPILTATTLEPNFTENTSPVAVFSGTTIDLVEGADLVKALTLTVSDLQNGNDEKLYIDGQAIALVAGSGTTTANNYVYNITELAGTATVTLTHASDIAVTDAQSLIDGLQYENTSEDIAGTSRTVTLTTLQDTGGTANGGDDTASVTIASTVSLLAVNDTPVLTAGNTLNYTENQPATIIDPTVTIQDVDNGNLESATISIGNYVLGSDVLAFTDTANITGNFNTTTGMLTLTGSDTLANYESALRSVTYQNTSNDPGTTKTITWVVNDGQDNSAGVISTIAITQVNDAPIVTATTLEPNFTENTAPVAIFSGTTIDLVEASDLVKTLTLTVGDLQNGSDERLYIDGQAIALVAGSGTTAANSYVYNITELAGTATVTLTHASDIAVTDAQILIDGLQYENTSENIVGTSRTVTLTTLQDTGGTANGGDDTTSVTIASTVSLLAVNDAPVLTAGNTLNYTENQPATIIDPMITIGDFDDTQLSSATIGVSANYIEGNDVLAFTDTANITGNFNTTTGMLTLTGSDTLANYESALRSVTYQNTSNDPGTTKTITWVVNDGQDNSAGVISTIAITQVNDAPIVTTTTLEPNFTENTAPVAIFSGTTIDLVEASDLVKTLTLTVGDLQNGSDERLYIDGQAIALVAGSGTTAANSYVYNITELAGTATVTLTHASDIAVTDAQSLIDGLQYENTSENIVGTSRTVTLTTLQDTGGTANGGDDTTSVTIASTVSLLAVNDAPVLTAGNILNYTENQPATIIDPTVTIQDVDNGNLESATISIGNYVLGSDVLAFTDTANITGNFNTTTGMLTLTGSDTLANYEYALRSVTYQNTSNDPGTTKTITWVVNDGQDNSAGVISTIAITQVNDAPILTTTTLEPNFTENTAPVAIFSGTTIDLVEASDLVKTLTLTVGDLQNGSDERLYIDGQAIALVAGSGTTAVNSYVYNITELAGTATVTLTHASDIAVTDAQSLIDGLQYENTSENIVGTSRTVTLTTLQDTGGTANGGDDTTSVTIASTVSLLAVNDAPVLTAGNILNYTENQPATIIDPTITIGDFDDTQLSSATIGISANYIEGNDVLAFTDTANITGNFNTTTGMLTLTGSDTLANYESALRSVTYQNTSNDPGTTKTITWVVNDGQDNSAGVISTIAITQVNDAPIVTTTTLEPNFTENKAPVAIFSGTTIDLVEASDLVKTLTLTVGDLQNGSDERLYIDGQAIALVAGSGTTAANSYVYNITELAGTATVTLTHASDIAVTDAQSLIDGLQYENTSENIVGTSRTVTLTTLQDTGGTANGGDDTTSVTIASTVSLLAVNDAPVLTAGNILNYTENQPATIIDPTITIGDFDDTQLSSATIGISANYIEGNDVLAFTDTANITGNFNTTTGMLTLTGSDTLANYESALRSVTYQNTSNDPGTTKTITWVVNDGQDNSAGVISTVAITQVNDAPIVTATTLEPNFTENTAPVAIFSGTTIDLVEASDLVKTLTLTVGDLQNGSDERLYIDGQAIALVAGSGTTAANSYVYNITELAGTATVTLTHASDIAVTDAQSLIDGLQYENTSENIVGTSRTVTLTTLQDTGGTANGGDDTTSVTIASTVSLLAVNDAPVLTAGNILNYTENQPATIIDPTVTIQDVDNGNLESATISIGNYVLGSDVLAFTDTANITGNFNTTTGMLTLTGSDTLANYESALRSVTYQNTSNDPGTTKTITWVVNDGQDNSAGVISTVAITQVNDAPIVTTTTLEPNFTENTAPVAIFSGTTIDLVEASDLVKTLTLTVGDLQNGSDERLYIDGQAIALVAGSGTTAANSYVYNITELAGTATMTLTHASDIAVTDAQSLIDGLQYENTSENIVGTSRTVTLTTLQDTGGTANGGDDTTSVTIASTVSLLAVNDAPVLTAGNILNYTENQPATIIDPTVTIQDVDNGNLESATISIGNYVLGSDVLAFTDTANITGNFNTTTGMLTLTGSDTLANYESALRSVTYQNTSNDPGTTKTITWVVNDGQDNSAGVISTIAITQVNDEPIVTTTTLEPNFTENTAPVAIFSGTTIDLVEASDLVKTLTLTVGDLQNGSDERLYIDGQAIALVAGSGTTAANSYVYNITELAGTATMTLTHASDIAVTDAQSLIDGLQYENTSENIVGTSRTVTLTTLQDTGGTANGGDDTTSVTIASTVSLLAVNDAPVLTAGNTLNYTENQPATIIDPTVTIQDVDNGNLESATISIGNYVLGSDVLAFANTGTITGSFDVTTGVLTLSGTDTVENYQAALQSITYENTSNDPETSKTITWRVNDGLSNSTPRFSVVNIDNILSTNNIYLEPFSQILTSDSNSGNIFISGSVNEQANALSQDLQEVFNNIDSPLDFFDGEVVVVAGESFVSGTGEIESPLVSSLKSGNKILLATLISSDEVSAIIEGVTEDQGKIEITNINNRKQIYFTSNSSFSGDVNTKLTVYLDDIVENSFYFELQVIQNPDVLMPERQSTNDDTLQVSDADGDVSLLNSLSSNTNEIVLPISPISRSFIEALQLNANIEELINLAVNEVNTVINNSDEVAAIASSIINQAIAEEESALNIGRIASGMLAASLDANMSAEIVLEGLISRLIASNLTNDEIARAISVLILEADKDDMMEVIQEVKEEPKLNNKDLDLIHNYLAEENTGVASAFLKEINNTESSGTEQQGMLAKLKDKLLGSTSGYTDNISLDQAIEQSYKIQINKAKLLKDFTDDNQNIA